MVVAWKFVRRLTLSVVLSSAGKSGICCWWFLSDWCVALVSVKREA